MTFASIRTAVYIIDQMKQKSDQKKDYCDVTPEYSFGATSTLIGYFSRNQLYNRQSERRLLPYVFSLFPIHACKQYNFFHK
jgi:hypothetical protein